MDNKLLSLSESRQNGHWVEGPETLLRVILGPNLLKSIGQIFKTRSRMATLLGALELSGGMLGPIV